MKKIAFALVATLLAVPALAQEGKLPPQGPDTPAVQDVKRDHEAFKKAREAHRAQMKATQEKMEKLVKEYNKLKEGKKKDAKRAEIEKEVNAIHQKQLEFKKDQLDKFEERLARMKADFDKENTADAQQAWTKEKTDALIQANGDVKALFGPRPDMGRGHRHHFKGPRMGRGPRPVMGGFGPGMQDEEPNPAD